MISFKIKVPERARTISSVGAVSLLNFLFNHHLWSQKHKSYGSAASTISNTKYQK